MKLKLSVPTHKMIDEQIIKVIAEAENGSFCILPRHTDFVAALVPGLLSYTRPNGKEQFIAVDEGLLIKQADLVLVSTRQAIYGGDLKELRKQVNAEFISLDERQRACQAAIASLEASFLRGFLQLEKETV